MPRTRQSVQDPALLAAALEGLEAQKNRIEEQIRQVRAMLGRRSGRAVASPDTAPEPPSGRRQLSSAAKKRIAAAQKRRWAEYRKKVAAAKK